MRRGVCEANPPVLCKPELGTPLRLYFAVTDKAISSVLLQKSIYFVSKVLQGPEVRYQALEKAVRIDGFKLEGG